MLTETGADGAPFLVVPSCEEVVISAAPRGGLPCGRHRADRTQSFTRCPDRVRESAL